MTSGVLVRGFFAGEHDCVHAIRALRAARYADVRAFTPFPSGEVLDALGLRTSPVRVWVLLGGIAGATSGFALTIGLSGGWYPHVTGGMPIVSIPPFVIIAFELMILFGSLAGAVGFVVHGRFPQLEAFPGYDPRFTDDRFGVVVACPPGRDADAERLLRDAGACEVDRAVA